jgi:hypothetical protein
MHSFVLDCVLERVMRTLSVSWDWEAPECWDIRLA